MYYLDNLECIIWQIAFILILNMEIELRYIMPSELVTNFMCILIDKACWKIKQENHPTGQLYRSGNGDTHL